MFDFYLNHHRSVWEIEHAPCTDLDFLGDAGDGEEVAVAVELDGRHDARVVVHVGRVVQRRQAAQAVEARELRQALAKIVQSICRRLAVCARAQSERA